MKNSKSGKKKKRTRKSLVRNSIVGVIAIITVLLTAYLVGRQLESSRNSGSVQGDLSNIDSGNIVEYKGERYRYNDKLLTILFMGTDQTAENAEPSGFRNGGQADFLMLLIIDPDNKTMTQLHIDRDTMTEITVLGVTGKVSGTRMAQICLSHGFGDGGEQSCEFTKEAVEQLLNDIEIDFYMALRMDYINELNDAVGGVTVRIEDDFSNADPSMEIGTSIKLAGDQAETFVRNRLDVGDGSNEARMRRQKQFFSEFSHMLEENIARDKDYVGVLYDLMESAMVTDMSRGRMINETNKAMGYKRTEALSLEGEHIEASDGYIQFHANEDALNDLVMNIFFTKVN